MLWMYIWHSTTILYIPFLFLLIILQFFITCVFTAVIYFHQYYYYYQHVLPRVHGYYWLQNMMIFSVAVHVPFERHIPCDLTIRQKYGRFLRHRNVTFIVSILRLEIMFNFEIFSSGDDDNFTDTINSQSISDFYITKSSIIFYSTIAFWRFRTIIRSQPSSLFDLITVSHSLLSLKLLIPYISSPCCCCWCPFCLLYRLI